MINDMKGLPVSELSSTSLTVNEITSSRKETISSNATSNTGTGGVGTGALEMVMVDHQSAALTSRLELIKRICELAEKQGKKTVPVELLKKALIESNLKLPNSLPSDITEVKYKVKEVERDAKGSKSCAIM